MVSVGFLYLIARDITLYPVQLNKYRLCTLALLVATIVTGYFSIPAALTCLIVVLVQSVTGALFKLYWSRKL